MLLFQAPLFSKPSKIKSLLDLGAYYLNYAKSLEDDISRRLPKKTLNEWKQVWESYGMALNFYQSALRSDPALNGNLDFNAKLKETQDGASRAVIHIGDDCSDSAKKREQEALGNKFAVALDVMRDAEELFGSAVKYYRTALYSDANLREDAKFLQKLKEAEDDWKRTGQWIREREPQGPRRRAFGSNKV